MKINWADPAAVDLEGISNYIAKGSEYYAAEFIEKILDSVEKLKELPRIGRIVPEAERDDIRELLFFNYRLIYMIKTEQILIIAVIHGARTLSKLRRKPWEIM